MPEPRLLYVDLDGTLVRTDTLWESVVLLLKQQPYTVFLLPMWLLRGKAGFKYEIGQRVALDAATLPYREEVVDFVQEASHDGVIVILATAADTTIAVAVQRHLPCIHDILASDGRTNLSGAAKRDAILAHAHGRPFAYIGDAPQDRVIWQVASRAHAVGTPASIPRLVPPGVSMGKIFSYPSLQLRDILQEIRVQQWAKNILIFIPLILAHRFLDGTTLLRGSIGFLTLSFVASGNYLLNDLLDLASDRRHSQKRFRPLAAGRVSILVALGCALVAFVVGFGGAYVFLRGDFVWLLAVYLVATNLYSWYIKRLIVADVMMLAGFYVYRLYAGAILMHITVSGWLFAFALFFFLGLAVLKRYTELHSMPPGTQNGRGYVHQDLDTLRMVGVGSHLVSLVVLSLYLHSADVTVLYSAPRLLWGVVVILLYWMMRMWIFSGRGIVHDDPVLFALKDRTSYAVLVLSAVMLWCANTL